MFGSANRKVESEKMKGKLISINRKLIENGY